MKPIYVAENSVAVVVTGIVIKAGRKQMGTI